MQNLSPANIGAFQKNETHVPNCISFSEMPCFFSPMIPIGGYHMKKKKRNENYAYVLNKFNGYDNHFN
jgi:hypothetical protein